MSVAPQFVSARRARSRRPAVASQLTQDKAKPRMSRSSLPHKEGGQRVEKLPSRQNLPIWLRTLLFLQRSSSVASFFLISATLALYGCTVYTQQMWSQEYRKLETMQRHERLLTATNEVLKTQLAKQAERPDTGLVAPNPANMLFLSPAPQRPPKEAPKGNSEPKPAPNLPLGY